MQFIPYVRFDGDCAEAFRFYAEVLGGELEALMSHGHAPSAGDVPAEWHDRILHARLVVRGQVLMGSDTPPGRYQKPQGMYVSLQIEEPADAERVFQAFAENGTVNMPLQQTFWAQRYGLLVDRFGIPWQINCT